MHFRIENPYSYTLCRHINEYSIPENINLLCYIKTHERTECFFWRVFLRKFPIICFSMNVNFLIDSYIHSFDQNIGEMNIENIECSRSLVQLYVVSYYINGTRLLRHTVWVYFEIQVILLMFTQNLYFFLDYSLNKYYY